MPYDKPITINYMKTRQLLKSLLLLCALIVGSVSAWAGEVTFTFNTDAGLQALGITKPSSGSGTDLGTDAYTLNGVSMTATNGNTNTRVWNSNGTLDLRIYKNGTLTFTAPSNITSIVLNGATVGVFSANDGTFSNGTWSGDAASVTLTATGTGKINTIKVTYSGGSTLTPCDLALTGTSNELSFDLYNNAEAQVINYTTSSTGAVTVSASDYITTTVDKDAKTITVTPLKKTPSQQTITVSQAADASYTAGFATFKVTIADSTPETGSWVQTDLADLTANDVFVIVGNNGATYAMSNDKGASNPPLAVAVTIANNEITSSVADNLRWNISGNATDGYTFYPNGTTTKWLYCTNTNNGVRVGDNTNKTFVVDGGYLKHSGTSRYVGIYNSQDWRCYTSTSSNIGDQTFAFYKYSNASVKKPIIDVAETFIGSTTATITCTTEGAAIYYSFDNTTWTLYTEPLVITETTTIYAKAILGEAESDVASVTTTKVLATPTVTIDATGITNTDVYQGTAAGSLAATVSYEEVPVEGATVTWSGDNDAVATIDVATGTVTLVAAGTVTFTAAFAGNESYNGATETYEMTVTNSDPNVPGASAENPYTVAQARAAIDAGEGTSNVYVAGIVYEGASYLSNGALTYWISDDGTETNKFQVYKGKGLDGADFESVDDVQVGDEVVVFGNIKKYNTTYEFDSGNYLVSLHRSEEPVLTVNPLSKNVSAEGGEGELAVSATNFSLEDVTGWSIEYYEGTEVATTAPTWITLNMSNDYHTLSYDAEQNDGDARTATFKLKLTYNDAQVSSDMITITQAKYTVATLPFSFDGGKSDVATKDGLAETGLGSDYKNSPKMKFDSTGDELILHFNAAPGVLTFDINGNSFSDGTFSLLASADRVEYYEVASFTDLGIVETVTIDNLQDDVRHLKWVYTEKSSGNVGLGNIQLYANAGSVTLAEACTDGEKYYATYSSSTPFVASAGLTVSEVAVENGYLTLSNYVENDVIAANTGVLISSNVAGLHNLMASTSIGGSLLGENNCLRPSGDAGITATAMAEADANCLFYRLTMHNGTDLGFWWGAAGGGAFAVAANKAYLAVPQSTARSGYSWFDDVTGVSATLVNSDETIVKTVYDLQGRRVENPTRGLYIVNGQKVLVK